ncbi:MAG: biotin-dependent carboxyltransferase family protein [Mesorhizobium sp.]
MTGLIVERIGTGASLQDGGRIGWRRFGISSSGAMDGMSLAVANILVGNEPCAAAIETVYAGARFRAEGGPVMVAAAGPGIGLSVAGRVVMPGHSALAEPGEDIELSPLKGGIYGYLAVAGGFDLQPDMGSLSTHLRSGLGPALLTAGNRLPVRGGRMTPLTLPVLPAHDRGPIRVIPGPQDDWFDDEVLALLYRADWQLDNRSDRMARFLVGPALAPRAGSMVSDGTVPGSIQVTPTGQPVLLMRDGQTTGGYPKITTVISADLHRLSQIPAGARFRFAPVSIEQAQAAAKAFARTVAGLKPVPAGGIDAGRLWSENLISGVWSTPAEG